MTSDKIESPGMLEKEHRSLSEEWLRSYTANLKGSLLWAKKGQSVLSTEEGKEGQQVERHATHHLSVSVKTEVPKLYFV